MDKANEEIQVKDKRLLIHKIGRTVKMKDVYALVMSRPIKNRMYKQSEWIHDNFYSEDLNYVAHLYMTDPNRN